MLKGFVSQLLADYLSTYVKDIQPDQIRVGLWNGVALLENVELQLDAFDYLQLPFVIKQGIVGKLRLQVPWKKLGREPLLIVLEDVCLCVCTPDEYAWNVDAIEARSLAAKKAKLAAAELGKLSAHLSQHFDNNAGQSFWSYLSTKIIGNIQIMVKHLHVQYVHQITALESFSFGMTFTSLTVCTLESNCRAVSAGSLIGGKVKGNMIHKLVEIQNLALYWNTAEKVVSDHTQESNGDYFKSRISKEHDKLNYILRPMDVSFQLLVKKNQAVDGTSPQYSIIFDINNMDISLDDIHVWQMVLLWDAVFVCRLREKYGRFRPSVGQPGYDRRGKGWQKAWWKYAIKSVVFDVNKKLYKSWSHLACRMDIRKQYVPLYKSKLECLLQHETVDNEKLQILEKLEEKLDLDEILSFRSMAEKQIQLENVVKKTTDNNASSNTVSSFGEQQVEDQPSLTQRSWLNLLSRGVLGAAGSKVYGQFTGFIPDEIIEDIYEATSYHPIRSSNVGELPKGYCRVVGTIKLKALHLVLRNLNPTRDFIFVLLRGFDASLRLCQHSANVSLKLEGVEGKDLVSNCLVLQGIFTDTGEGVAQSYGDVVTGATSQQGDFTCGPLCQAEVQPIDNGTAKICFLVADLDFFPINTASDLIVKVVMQPLKFVYSTALVTCLDAFFAGWRCASTQQKLIASSLDRLGDPRVGITSISECTSTTRQRISWKLDIDRAVLLFPWNMGKSSALTLVTLLGVEVIPEEWQGDASLITNALGYQSKHKLAKYEKIFGLYEQFELQAHNIKLCLDGRTSMKSIYQQITGCLDDALLKFVQFDCHRELQIRVKHFCVDKTLDECAEVSPLSDFTRTDLVLSGSSLCLRLSEKYSFQGAASVAYNTEAAFQIREETGFMGPSLFNRENKWPSSEGLSHSAIAPVEWECLVCDLSLVPKSAAGKEHETFAKLGSVRFRGLVRTGILEALKVEAPDLVLMSVESYVNNHLRELLKCTSVEAACPALEISLTSTSMGTTKISIFVRVAEVFLFLTSWSKVIRTISSLAYSFSWSSDGRFTGKRSDGSGYSNASHPVDELSYLSGSDSNNQITGDVSFSMNFLGISFILPDLNIQQDEPVADRSNHAFETYVNQGQKRRLMQVKAAVHIEELTYKESRLMLVAKSSMWDCYLRESYDETDQGWMFFQIMDMSIEGNFCMQEHQPMRAIARAQVDKLDIWFSYATVCFLKSFCFPRIEPVSDSFLVFDMDINTGIQQVSLLLIDGRWSCHIPIFQLFVENVVGQLVMWQDILDLSVTFQIEADYYNLEKVSWEPLLEPGNMSILLKRTCASVGLISRVCCTNTRITSFNQLNFNVTGSLSQAIAHSIEMFKDALNASVSFDDSTQNDDGKSKERKIMGHYAPYWLQNDTGVAIQYWLIDASKNEDGDTNAEGIHSATCEMETRGTQNILQPGSSNPLYIEENPKELFCRNKRNHWSEGQTDKKPFDRSHRMICVQLEGTLKPSIPLSMDLVGSRAFDVVFSQSLYSSEEHAKEDQLPKVEKQTDDGCNEERYGGFSTPVVFEVSFQHYSKLVRIYSTVILVNATSIPVEVRFDIPFGVSPKIMEPMTPGQVIPLPVHLAETGQIRRRPMNNDHLWSEAQSLSNILLPAYRSGSFRSVICYPIHHSKAAFRFCINVKETCIPAASMLCFATEKSNESAQLWGKMIKHSLQKQKSLDNGYFKCFNSSHVIVREITLQAPLVFNNCLPLPLSLLIDTGTGAGISVSAPEGNALFILDVNPVHELSLKLNISGYSPCSIKIARPTMPTPNCKGVPLDNERVSLTETVVLNAENPNGFPVCTKIVMLLDSASGAREVCIFAPYWLYNCTGVELAITDGDIDKVSERNETVVQLSTGGLSSKSYGLSMLQQGTKAAGLQTILDQETDKSGHHSSSFFPDQQQKMRLNILHSKLIKHGYYFSDPSTYWTTTLCQPSDSVRCTACIKNTSLQATGKKDISIFNKFEVSFPKAHIYSPLKNDQEGDKQIRVRVLAPNIIMDRVQEQYAPIWSRPFPLNPPGGMTTVVVPHELGKGAYIFSVLSAPCLGSCSGRTRTVTLRPRFVLANACKQDLCYKQHGTEKFERISAGHQSQLHWSDRNIVLLVSIRFDEHGWDWSGGFVPEQLGDTQLKARNHGTSVTEIIRVEIQSAKLVDCQDNDIGSPDNGLGTILILFSNDETGFMPYRIDNLSKERIKFYQQKCQKHENTLLPYSSCSYAWDEPWKPHRIVLEIPGEGCLGTFQMEEVKKYPDVQLSAQKLEKKFSISVHAEGPIKVLSIHDMSLDLVSNLNDTHTAEVDKHRKGIVKGEDAYAHCTDVVVFQFPSIGFSIVDSSPKEIVFACARGINLHLLQGAQQQQLHLQVASFQIDNQLRHAQYPVMVSAGNSSVVAFAPLGLGDMQLWKDLPMNFSSEAAFNVVIVKWRHLASSVDCFQNVTVRVAPVHVELEEQAICSMFRVSRSIFSYLKVLQAGNATAEILTSGISSYCGPDFVDNSISRYSRYERETLFSDSMASFPYYVKFMKHIEYRSWPTQRAVEYVENQVEKLFVLARRSRKVYIELLEIAPVDLIVSFSWSPWLPEEDCGAAEQSLFGIAGSSVQRGLMALVDVEKVPVHFRHVMFAHPLASWDTIRSTLLRHYTRQLLHEVYKIVGSVGVFGNPMGVIRSLGNGFRDFVSVPARSFLQNPRYLASGISQGTRSLVNNTVFALSNAAAQMSQAARKGVTALAFDDEYIAGMQKQEQEDFQENGVLNELLKGLTGLLQSPLVGAEKHGVPGILSGFAGGAVRLIARPTASVLKVAGRTAQSIRSWSQPDRLQERRIRPPRHLSKNGVLLPYSLEVAVGTAVLEEVVNIHLKTETYVICKPMSQPGRYILLTKNLLLKVRSTSQMAIAGESTSAIGPEWGVDFEIRLADILHIDTDGCVLNILLGSLRCSTKRLHGSRLASDTRPLLHESIMMVSEAAAKELSFVLRILVYQQSKCTPQFIAATRL